MRRDKREQKTFSVWHPHRHLPNDNFTGISKKDVDDNHYTYERVLFLCLLHVMKN